MPERWLRDERLNVAPGVWERNIGTFLYYYVINRKRRKGKDLGKEQENSRLRAGIRENVQDVQTFSQRAIAIKETNL